MCSTKRQSRLLPTNNEYFRRVYRCTPSFFDYYLLFPEKYDILLNNGKITGILMEASADHVPEDEGSVPDGEAFSVDRKEVRAWFQARYYRKQSMNCGPLRESTCVC